MTHAHGDHACGAKFFKEKLGAQIIASDIDARLMEEGTDEELGLNIARGPIYPSDYKYIHTKVDKGGWPRARSSGWGTRSCGS